MKWNLSLFKLSFSTCQNLEGFIFLDYDYTQAAYWQLIQLLVLWNAKKKFFLLVWNDVAWLVVVVDARSLLSVYNVGFCQTIGFHRVFNHWRVKSKQRYGAIYLNYLYYLLMDRSTVGTWLYSVYIVLLFYLRIKA